MHAVPSGPISRIVRPDATSVTLKAIHRVLRQRAYKAHAYMNAGGVQAASPVPNSLWPQASTGTTLVQLLHDEEPRSSAQQTPGCCGFFSRSAGERCAPTVIQDGIESMPNSKGMQALQLTRMDELHVLLQTVVALPAVLLPPPIPGGPDPPSRQRVVNAVQHALQQVMIEYPVMCSRLLSTKEAQRVVGTSPLPGMRPIASPSPDLLLVFPQSPGAQPSAQTEAPQEDGTTNSSSAGVGAWGVPLTLVHLKGTTWRDVAVEAAHRSTTGIRPALREALPPYLPTLDMGRLARGLEPLTRMQLSYVDGGGVLLGLTTHHAVADASTLAGLMTALVRKAHQHLDLGAIKPNNALNNEPSGSGTDAGDSSGHSMPARAATPAGQVPAGPAAALDSASSMASSGAGVATPTLMTKSGGVPSGCKYDRSSLHLDPAVLATRPVEPSAAAVNAWVTVVTEPGGLLALTRSNIGAIQSLSSDVRTLGWGVLTGGMATPVLHLTGKDLQRLKEACQELLSSHPSTAGLRLSQHDVAAAVLWLLCCHTRGRPLPGQPLEPDFAASSGLGGDLEGRMFGITIDMRQNCLNPPLVGLDHLGNASCSLHARGTSNSGPGLSPTLPARPYCVALAPVAWPCRYAPGAQAKTTHAWVQGLCAQLVRAASIGDGSDASHQGPWEVLVSLVATAAARVREGVNMYRSIPDVGTVTLSAFQDHAQAKGLALLCTMAKYITQYDGFMTSWAAFPMQPMPAILDLKKPPASSGTAPAPATPDPVASNSVLTVLQPIIHPLAPWTGIAIPGPPVAPSPACRTGADGLMLYFTSPAACEQLLRDSVLIKALMPTSRWM